MHQKRESLAFDVVFAGGGPANLAAAIHLKNLIGDHNNRNGSNRVEAEIALIDKGRHAGAHLLSGAVLDTRALEELMPDYRERNCPLETSVAAEGVFFLTEKKKFAFPFLPEPFRNKGYPFVSLSRFGAWLAGEAEKAGVQLFDNTAATAPLVEEGTVCGVLTGDLGLDRQGNQKPDYLAGIELRAKITVFGEGAAGNLTDELQRAFPVQTGSSAQLYETGVKEVWRIPAGRMEAGDARHTFGYPLPSETYGGGWLYAFTNTDLSVGFVTAIDRTAPMSDPHLNLQLFKQHPFVASILEGGTLVEYGAKAITSGGLNAMARIFGPGFLVTGESAGMLNMQRLKGIHLAMKSGMLAAETIFEALLRNDFSAAMLQGYETRFRNSWAYEELLAARNFRQAFDNGLYYGLLQSGMELKFPGVSLASGFLRKKEGSGELRQEKKRFSGAPPKPFHPDGKLTFGKEECLYRSGTMHEENQPCHLRINPSDMAEICLERCREEYGNPCSRFCPAKVYEFTETPEPALKINASNCLHCKTCTLADPYGIISWTPPEGGGGPGYKLS
ncbi:Electron-transferring-flavoprotein dehydrogenase [Chlorobium limicola DSM 245]|uniref:Electron transfer flavoprotein-ubiquinone oxidoreductase n=1 Tax=Chlorobium limicola (strain DSM 245 / NBRC 103803 / 6330) TaxID=290315 RepID=B3EG79_CHLL2|nr:electron-transfer flavoprotein:ubiquinone oxidoreductase [Chlorobium limicola]ACD91088.1 Electron-transferring-flavoprotein dehydrogenase [Chlorobium limicola DSM 245]